MRIYYFYTIDLKRVVYLCVSGYDNITILYAFLVLEEEMILNAFFILYMKSESIKSIYCIIRYHNI